MSSPVQKATKKLVYLLGLAGLVWGSCSAAVIAQNRTEILRIDRRYVENVQRYRRNWEVARRDQVLTNGNWLATSRNSMAWMWYVNIGIVYRQHAFTTSRFVPRSRCGFRVSSGRSLFLDSGRFRNCYQIVEGLRIGRPRGFSQAVSGGIIARGKEQVESTSEEAAAGYFLSRNGTEGKTLVGVLANPEQEPIEITNQVEEFTNADAETVGNTLELRAGEFAIVRDDGSFVRGEFNIQAFLNNNPLARGLGDSLDDIAYVDTLESLAERELFAVLRSAVLSARAAQPTPGAFELRNLTDRELSPLSPTPPECAVIDIGDNNEGDPSFVSGCLN